MRVAFVQDWLTVEGGAEKVTKEILSLYPEADVFSLIDFLNDSDRKNILQGKRAAVSFLQKMPFVHKHYRWYLPFFPYAIEQLDLSRYDLIISSSYAVAKGVLSHSEQRHICYCHSPMRYAWDLQNEYLDGMKDSVGIKRMILRYFLNKIRIWDVTSSNRVDYFLANSENVRKRIAKIYRRESKVVHPPVNLSRYKPSTEKADFYLTASRLVEYKRIDLIVKAFSKMPGKRLIVMGSGPEYKRLRKLAKGHDNIELTGQVEEAILLDKMQKARAFIMAAHEDFGITSIEAQASGTPVVAYGRGGILETTVEGKTAVYFYEQSEEAIVKAIHTFEKTLLLSSEKISASVAKFDTRVFREKFQSEVERCLSN